MKRIVVLGAAESGVGAAVLAKIKGFNVFVSDYGKIKAKYKNVLSHYNIDFEENKHSLDLILNADEIVKSPGIPDTVSIIKAIREKSISIISEIEFAGRYCTAKKICITGSNGKTTTATMAYECLKAGGFNVGLGGNIGKSFAMQIATEKHDYYVLEISSFQLDGMFDFKADIAIITNITPDHLDRYDYNFQNYIDSKFRILQNQTENDAFIYGADDEIIQKEIQKRKIKAKQYPFSFQNKKYEKGAYIEKNKIIIKTKNNQLDMTLEELALQGKANAYNTMASGLAARLVEVRNKHIKNMFKDFQGVEHRMEFIAKIRGVEYINDSKATNVNSTWYSLERVHAPVVWIVGGKDKGNDYSPLIEMVKAKVKVIICLGVDNQKIIDTFSPHIETIIQTKSMSEAVQLCYYYSEKDDTVLLSPANASFDLFENFEDRGNQFRRAVGDL